MIRLFPLAILPTLLLAGLSGCHTPRFTPGDNAKHYTKSEHMAPMRDGVKLFTAVYSPRHRSRPAPILLCRTPYSCSPYGTSHIADALGPTRHFAEDGYILVYQDVRGKFMSEGEFVNMRPHIDRKSGPRDIDESSDTYDTIEWIIRNVPNHNGRVGLWGISYPGFYAAAGMIDTHPALKAVSPQAPIADWFIGDDFHHNGAFFLFDAFTFFSSFGRPRNGPTTKWTGRFEFPMPDAYRFFLELGPLANVNSRHFKGEIGFWNDLMSHGSYDEFWQSRNLLPHLQNIRCAVMTVGGWFDAEDLYGPLRIYDAVERRNPGIENTLVLGPWSHGGWNRTDGDELGDMTFNAKTSLHYRDAMQHPFFRRHLDGGNDPAPAEVMTFVTGANTWRQWDHWPPAATQTRYYLAADGALSTQAPGEQGAAFDEFLSDPARPVPYSNVIGTERGRTYMTEDQRFAARRPDVLVYQTPELQADLSLAGPIVAELQFSTTGSDADLIVKVIDVMPDDAADASPNPRGIRMGGYQMLLRAEVMRARFRDNPAAPAALVPGVITPVKLELRDVCHTFKRGHRLMVQVQSSWFPLVDRNPQTFVDIRQAGEADFQKATHRVHRGAAQASAVVLPVVRL